ncbi:hypothetical protein GCM10027294_37900 [Marinactinospora endophytica]
MNGPYQTHPYHSYPSPYPPRPAPGSSPQGICGLILLALFCAAPVLPVAVVLVLPIILVLMGVFTLWYAMVAMRILFDALWWVYRAPQPWLVKPRRVPERPSGADPAHLGYFGGQARADHAYVVQICRGRSVYLLREHARRIRSAYRWKNGAAAMAGRVLGLGRFGGLAIGGVLIGAPVLIAGLVLHTLVVLCCVVIAWAAERTLRLLDRVAMRARGVRAMTCPLPGCYERIDYPAYRCAGCSRLHRDIRPGRHGVLRRTCDCGAEMPTLLLLGAARKLEAACPHCERPLAHRPGETREFVLPLFGAAGAGKTRLMTALHGLFEHAAREPGVTLEHADTETGSRLRASSATLTPERMMNPTPPGRDPHGMLLRFSHGRRTLLVHLYDAAGERFDRVETTQTLRYLGRASTFVLVVDPLALDGLWNALAEEERVRLARYRSPGVNAEQIYQQTYQQIERQLALSRTGLDKARLAIVFTRGDLLAGSGAAPRPGEDVADWARETLGLGNLLLSVDNNFGEWAVFHTAAVVDGAGTPDPSLALLADWLLRKEAREFRAVLGGRGMVAG